MSWTFLLAALGVFLCVAAALPFLVRRRAASRRSQGAPGQPIAATADGSPASLFGLAPQEAAQFRQSARSDMAREQLQWDRDYLPSVTDGAMPGRIAGIPRTLRVKR